MLTNLFFFRQNEHYFHMSHRISLIDPLSEKTNHSIMHSNKRKTLYECRIRSASTHYRIRHNKRTECTFCCQMIVSFESSEYSDELTSFDLHGLETHDEY